MVSCASSNKLAKGKNQRVPQNLDNPKNVWTLKPRKEEIRTSERQIFTRRQQNSLFAFKIFEYAQ